MTKLGSYSHTCRWAEPWLQASWVQLLDVSGAFRSHLWVWKRKTARRPDQVVSKIGLLDPCPHERTGLTCWLIMYLNDNS